MRRLIVAMAVLVAGPLIATRPAAARPADHAPKVDPGNAPFRAKLVSNAAVVRRAASTFANVAKRPPPAKLSGDQRKLYEEHTKWLSNGAMRLGALHSQMDHVLAKGTRASATELAQTNMSYLTLRESIETEARRFDSLTTSARARHRAAMNAIRAEK